MYICQGERAIHTKNTKVYWLECIKCGWRLPDGVVTSVSVFLKDRCCMAPECHIMSRMEKEISE